MQIKAKYLKLRNKAAAEHHTATAASKATPTAATPASTLQDAMAAVAAAGGMNVVMDARRDAT